MANAFNRAAGRWWSELHRVAKVRADRATGIKGKLLARVWEKQKRGLAHVHGLLDVSTPANRTWSEAYVNALCELAPSKGFGFVDGWAKIGHRSRAGAQAGAIFRANSFEAEQKGRTHRDCVGRRPSARGGVRRARPYAAERVHHAYPAQRPSAMGMSRGADRQAESLVPRMARCGRDADQTTCYSGALSTVRRATGRLRRGGVKSKALNSRRIRPEEDFGAHTCLASA